MTHHINIDGADFTLYRNPDESPAAVAQNIADRFRQGEPFAVHILVEDGEERFLHIQPNNVSYYYTYHSPS